MHPDETKWYLTEVLKDEDNLSASICNVVDGQYFVENFEKINATRAWRSLYNFGLVNRIRKNWISDEESPRDFHALAFYRSFNEDNGVRHPNKGFGDMTKLWIEQYLCEKGYIASTPITTKLHSRGKLKNRALNLDNLHLD
ncbi:MAG: hypothetical protein U9R08_03100 [Nanoarchaeota archaeon]|nr:hypothetical protein [Nanoarchaeota archaeon]